MNAPVFVRHFCPWCDRLLHAYQSAEVIVGCPACRGMIRLLWPPTKLKEKPA